VYWRWVQGKVRAACEARAIVSRWGWRMAITKDTSLRTIQNHPIQNMGAHILQFAVIELTELGVDVCCPLHDAILTECDDAEVDRYVEIVRSAMERAAEAALGMPIPTDHEKVVYPDRYMDKRPGSREMYDKVLEALVFAEQEVDEEGGGEVGRSGRSRGTYNILNVPYDQPHRPTYHPLV
jgi:hypothetical protein